MSTSARGQADHKTTHDMEVAMKWLRERHKIISPGKPFNELAAEKWAMAATMKAWTQRRPMVPRTTPQPGDGSPGNVS